MKIDQAKMRIIGDVVNELINDGVPPKNGFAILVVPIGMDTSEVQFVANIDRAGVSLAFEAYLKKWKELH